ncbi:ACT domain-containing protein [Candidatus Micrarchaeota archaeon]|nr:ACT domain-containing protein [Candidatus Micrarchaeota archaeon]
MNVITVVVDDKVGILADIAGLFAKAKINIRSVDADVVAGKGLISLELEEEDLDKGRRLLEDAGYKTEKADSAIIKLADRPGELCRITAMLSKEGISIISVHTISRDGKSTLLSLRTSKPKMAAAILKELLVVPD